MLRHSNVLTNGGVAGLLRSCSNLCSSVGAGSRESAPAGVVSRGSACHARRGGGAGRGEAFRPRRPRVLILGPDERKEARHVRKVHGRPSAPRSAAQAATPAISLLQTARHGLAEAAQAAEPASRYVAAHLA